MSINRPDGALDGNGETTRYARKCHLRRCLRWIDSTGRGLLSVALVRLYDVVFQIQKPALDLFRQRLDDLDGVS